MARVSGIMENRCFCCFEALNRNNKCKFSLKYENKLKNYKVCVKCWTDLEDCVGFLGYNKFRDDKDYDTAYYCDMTKDWLISYMEEMVKEDERTGEQFMPSEMITHLLKLQQLLI